MSGPAVRMIEANGLRVRVLEAGTGPLVVLCHGFPETSHSWRHQLSGLAAAGFRAVAPDMRGYGGTDAPAAVDAYTILHLVGDVVGLVEALGEERAVIAGHDWGAPVAWHAALLRPDMFRAVVGLSVPFVPRGRTRPTGRMPVREDARFYQLYFQDEGVAEAELERDVRGSLRAILCSGFGAHTPREAIGMVPRSGGFLTGMEAGAALPEWLGEADLDAYAAAFEVSGFRGGLNWYRNIDRNWELLAPWTGREVTAPALFIGGELDPVLRFAGMDRVVASLGLSVPLLRGSVVLPGCGHWTQQERAREVTDAMVGFLRDLPA
jgi:pimeloyl-ACP methyl ester carboxylesterase